MEKYVWVTWKNNNSPRYDGKTHKIPVDSLVDPPEDISVGQPVTVFWEHSKKKFWTGEIAPEKAEPKTQKVKTKTQKAQKRKTTVDKNDSDTKMMSSKKKKSGEAGGNFLIAVDSDEDEDLAIARTSVSTQTPASVDGFEERLKNIEFILEKKLLPALLQQQPSSQTPSLSQQMAFPRQQDQPSLSQQPSLSSPQQSSLSLPQQPLPQQSSLSLPQQSSSLSLKSPYLSSHLCPCLNNYLSLSSHVNLCLSSHRCPSSLICLSRWLYHSHIQTLMTLFWMKISCQFSQTRMSSSMEPGHHPQRAA